MVRTELLVRCSELGAESRSNGPPTAGRSDFWRCVQRTSSLSLRRDAHDPSVMGELNDFERRTVKPLVQVAFHE